MKTKKQKELIDSFLRTLDDEDKSVYRDIIVYLSELGYNPKKERSHISFKHSRHNKQIAKIGIRNKKELSHFFALRFSACNDYSQKFAEVVRTNIEKYPSKTPAASTTPATIAPVNPTHISTAIPTQTERKKPIAEPAHWKFRIFALTIPTRSNSLLKKNMSIC